MTAAGPRTPIDLALGVPTYNSSRYLDDLFSSLRAQTRVPRFVVFTDNRSTDDTVERIRRFKAESPWLDVRIHVNHSNLGIAGNYNRIVEVAPLTTWLQILDSDDYLLGDYYASLAPLLGAQVDLIVTSMRTSSRALNAYVGSCERGLRLAGARTVPSWLQLLGSVTTRSALVYRASRLKEERFIDPLFDGSDIIHTERFRGRSLYFPEARVFYRVHPASATTRLEQDRAAARSEHEQYLAFVATLGKTKQAAFYADFVLRKKIGRLFRQG